MTKPEQYPSPDVCLALCGAALFFGDGYGANWQKHPICTGGEWQLRPYGQGLCFAGPDPRFLSINAPTLEDLMEWLVAHGAQEITFSPCEGGFCAGFVMADGENPRKPRGFGLTKADALAWAVVGEYGTNTANARRDGKDET